MIRINLLPVKKAKKRGVGQKQIIVFAGFIVVLVIVLFFVQSKEEEGIATLQTKTKEVKEEIKRLDELIGDVNSHQKMKADLENKLNVIKLLEKGKQGPVRVLDELSTVIPKKVWLDSMVQSGDRLTMKGQATENREIAVFMKNLEASKFFSDVRLVSISTGKSKRVASIMSFGLNCKYHIPK